MLAVQNAFSFHREILLSFKTGYISEEGPTSHDFPWRMDEGLRGQNISHSIRQIMANFSRIHSTGKKKKIVVLCSRPSQNVKTGRFTH